MSLTPSPLYCEAPVLSAAYHVMVSVQLRVMNDN